MKNQKGFSLAVILLIILLISFVGFAAWYVYDKNTNKSVETSVEKSEPEKTASDKKVEPKTNSYTSALYGIKFNYPDGWKVSEKTYDNGYKELELNTADYSSKETEIGAMETKNGALVTLAVYPWQKSVDEYYVKDGGLIKSLIDNGSIRPYKVKIGSYEGKEFNLAYEMPERTQTYLLLPNNKILVAIFNSKDNSHTDKLFTDYYSILSSIE